MRTNECTSLIEMSHTLCVRVQLGMRAAGKYLTCEYLSDTMGTVDCCCVTLSVQNGLIGKAELVKYFKEEAKFDMTEEDADALMQHLDEDGNDVIDLGELEVRSCCLLRFLLHSIHVRN